MHEGDNDFFLRNTAWHSSSGKAKGAMNVSIEKQIAHFSPKSRKRLNGPFGALFEEAAFLYEGKAHI